MRHRGFLVFVFLIGTGLAWGGPAAAECLTGLESPTVDTTGYYIGLRGDTGSRDWVGQQFTTDCDGQFLTVSFMVRLDLAPLFDVANLIVGDTVFCTVMDDLNQPIATVEATLGSHLTQWVNFDFEPLELGLAAGVLSAKIGTTLDGFCWVLTGGDLGPGGLVTGNEDSSFFYDDMDAAFRVTWDPEADVVGAETQSWGAVKVLYR